MDTSIFGDEKTSKPKFNSRAAKEKTITSPTTSQLKKLRKIDLGAPAQLSQEELVLTEGMEVEHDRFGSGVVQRIEGTGNDKKAVIVFIGFGVKNLLLRFAKLKIK